MKFANDEQFRVPETKPGHERGSEGLRHRRITPPVLYFGTPVGLVTTISDNKGRFRYEPNKFAAAGLTRLESGEVAPPPAQNSVAPSALRTDAAFLLERSSGAGACGAP